MEKRVVIACDDGVVNKLGGGWTIISCVLWRRGEGPVRIGHLPVHIDGLDASGQVAYIASALSNGLDVEGVLFDSITTAGFNLISPPQVQRAARAPVIILYKRRPRWTRILAALERHFSDAWLRLRVISLVRDVVQLSTRRGVLYAILWGLSSGKAVELIEKYQVAGRMPEPLRFVHLYASALSRVLIQ